MNAGMLIGVLRTRAALRSHERWTRDELLARQARALRELRAFAVANSAFYGRLHRGLDDAPLEALAIVTGCGWQSSRHAMQATSRRSSARPLPRG